jgi:hypothetical protein
VKAENGGNASPTLPEPALRNGSIISSAIAGNLRPKPSPTPVSTVTKANGVRRSGAGLPKSDDCWLYVIALRWCEGDEKAAEAVHEDLLQKARELAGPCPTLLEVTLATTAALCWYELSYRIYNASMGKMYELDMSQTYYNRALKRYLSVMRTLANIQKLDLPSIQINIAGRQQVVNTPRNA